MNNPEHAEPAPKTDGDAELHSAMFASLIIQQTNMASIFLGLAPHPQTGQVTKDLEHAQFFIDQIEMLEAKTRGNLDKNEQGLLKQSLTTLRLAFVEAASATPAAAPVTAVDEQESPPGGAVKAAETPAEAAGAPTEAPASEESRKKFSKKY